MTNDRVLFAFPIESIGYLTDEDPIDDAIRRYRQEPRKMPLMPTERRQLGRIVRLYGDFANRLAAARAFHRITQCDLARRAGITQQAISSYESGERCEPTIRVLRRLATSLDIDAGLLLGAEI